MKVLVIGAGAAGLAAAHQAYQHGAQVRLLHDRVGCSGLYTGAVDLNVWTQGSVAMLSPACERFVESFGLWRLDSDVVLATISGVLRVALGADAALLNLAPLAGKLIGVPVVERDDWDAALLVRSLRESSWARVTATRFETVEVPLLQAGYERRIAAHDFAELHDQPERRRWFCERLGNASAPDAWLVGPWLGLDPDTAGAISQELGTPVGEVTSLPGGAAGARFVRARDRLLHQLGVDCRQARVERIERRGTRWQVQLNGGAVLHADAVVLAVGGVAGGGIELEPVSAQSGRQSFRLSLDAPVELLIRQKPVENVASAHGFDFASSGLSVLERIGARTRPGSEGLFLAGDVMAGRPNTVMMAVGTGIAAIEELFGAGGVQFTYPSTLAD